MNEKTEVEKPNMSNRVMIITLLVGAGVGIVAIYPMLVITEELGPFAVPDAKATIKNVLAFAGAAYMYLHLILAFINSKSVTLWFAKLVKKIEAAGEFQ